MGSPAGAQTFPGGAFTFQPPNQAGAANQFQALTSAFQPAASNIPSVNPATQAYNYDLNAGYQPAADALSNLYLTGGGSPTGAMSQALTGASAAAQYGLNDLFPLQKRGSTGLFTAAQNNLPYANSIYGQINNPLYGNIVSQTQNNPYFQQALRGAQQGATYGGAGAGALQSAGMGLLNTGFDPQSRLFNRTQQQVLDQTQAANAMSGVGNTPYGSSVTGNALSNFDINWQNNLLNRQQQAAGAASPLLQAAPQLAGSSAAMPYNTQQGQLGNILNALKAQSGAGVQGAAGLSTLLGGLGQGLQQAGTLGGQAVSGLGTSSSLPYSTGAGIGQNALNALTGQQNLLGGQANIGNAAFQPQQQLINELASYLGLGQSAAVNSANLGQLGFNQLSQGIGGGLSALGGASNLLFGSNSGGLLGGLGGLGGLGSGATSITSGALGPGLIGGDLTIGGGGGGGLLSSLPLIGAPFGS